MNACADSRSLIDDALDGRLDAGARSDFDAHLRQCAACTAEWKFAKSVRSSLLKVGFDRAPAGLRESIAAQVKTLGGRVTAPTNYGGARTGWFRSPAFLRSAAGILVIVAIGWVGTRFRTTDRHSEPPGSGGAPPRDEKAPAMAKDTGAGKPKAPAAITVEPAGEVVARGREADAGFSLGDPRSAEALDKARAIALDGVLPADALDKAPGATPEQIVRQAETLVWLEKNLGAILDRAGDTAALRQLAADADETLRDFAAGEKKKDEAPSAPSARSEKTEGEVSALKVTQARQAAGARRDQTAVETASYAVTGPGVIARVERVLADRGIAFQQVWLKDQDPNLRKRNVDQAATGYRIVEADVPEALVNEVVGDLESLDGIRLAPVGPSGGGAPGRAGARAAGDASAESHPAPRAETAARQKPLGMRKLRLVLISR